MSKKLSHSQKKNKGEKPAGNPLLLTLTLVPLIIGIALIIAWILDWSLLENIESQTTVGFAFILFGFAASNLIQKKWTLAAGWGVLLAADCVILAWLNTRAQAVAFVIGALGLLILAIEFYRQYRENRNKV